MCITYPTQITELKDGIAKSERGIELKTSLIPDLKIGDWVLFHANLVLKKISKQEAEEINELFNNIQIYE